MLKITVEFISEYGGSEKILLDWVKLELGSDKILSQMVRNIYIEKPEIKNQKVIQF